VGAGLLEEAGGGGQRRGGGGLVGPERQVGYDQGPAGAAHDGGGERDQFVHRDRDRGVVAVDHHRGGVADKQHRNPGPVEDPRGERVVGGEHGPPLAPRLRGGDVAHGDPAPGG